MTPYQRRIERCYGEALHRLWKQIESIVESSFKEYWNVRSLVKQIHLINEREDRRIYQNVTVHVSIEQR